MKCRRCGNRFGAGENWIWILRHRKDPGHAKFFYICEDCAESLLSWAGVPAGLPLPPESAPAIAADAAQH